MAHQVADSIPVYVEIIRVNTSCAPCFRVQRWNAPFASGRNGSSGCNHVMCPDHGCTERARRCFRPGVTRLKADHSWHQEPYTGAVQVEVEVSERKQLAVNRPGNGFGQIAIRAAGKYASEIAAIDRRT